MIVRGAYVLRESHRRTISSINGEIWRNVLRHRMDGDEEEVVSTESRTMEKILKCTEITNDHMTPEIKLFLLTPRCPLYHAPYEDDTSESTGTNDFFRDPFWSIYWPGGQALTRFILDEGRRIFPSTMSDCRVLDLGAGCGASAIAAKMIGAKEVLANDIDRVACTAIRMNGILNDVDVEVSDENLLLRLPDTRFDVILVGDLLYDEEISRILLGWLEEASGRGARIYLGDPGRHGLTENTRKRLTLLRRYSLPENVRKENHGFDTAGVWEFRVS